jgi:hypothetical protein
MHVDLQAHVGGFHSRKGRWGPAARMRQFAS